MTLKALRAVLNDTKYMVRANFAGSDKTEVVRVDYRDELDEFMSAVFKILDWEKMRAKVSSVRYNKAAMQTEIAVIIG